MTKYISSHFGNDFTSGFGNRLNHTNPEASGSGTVTLNRDIRTVICGQTDVAAGCISVKDRSS